MRESRGRRRAFASQTGRTGARHATGRIRVLGVYVRRWELFEGERGDEGREMWRALDEQFE